MDLRGKHVEMQVMFDMVRIEIFCSGDYEAQVLFDDIADTIKAGGTFEMRIDQVTVTPTDKSEA